MSALGTWIYLMARKRNPTDALMFKLAPPEYGDLPPIFLVVESGRVQFWRQFGWVLLADEKTVRWADLDEVRREDEKGRR